MQNYAFIKCIRNTPMSTSIRTHLDEKSASATLIKMNSKTQNEPVGSGSLSPNSDTRITVYPVINTKQLRSLGDDRNVAVIYSTSDIEVESACLLTTNH